MIAVHCCENTNRISTFNSVAGSSTTDSFHVLVIVALIFKEIGTKLDSVYQRVGRALIPIDSLGKGEMASQIVDDCIME